MKTFTGTVISLKSKKTATVVIRRVVTHPLYGKQIRKQKRIHAHYEGDKIKLGDSVSIVETKPLSKTKYFRILEER